MTARFLIGDVFDGLATLEGGSVDLVVTSPPFLALRSYLPADHPDKAKEIGSEATPAAFLDVMLAVMAELRRVVAPHGSICVELGDTYAGSGGPSGDSLGNGLLSASRHGAMPKGVFHLGPGWPLAKSRTLIPELFRIALAYGFNPLTGQESPAGRWLIRNVVTWCRPNPPVGALGDKWRPATSDVVVACISPKRFWDDLATRKPHSQVSVDRALRGRGENAKDQKADPFMVMSSGQGHRGNAEAGAPLLDYWVIPPTGYAGAHYAVYPPALVEPLVKAMCPQKVCLVCGEPSRRIVEKSERYQKLRNAIGDFNQRENGQGSSGSRSVASDAGGYDLIAAEYETLGFTDCGHDNYRPGRVLDPFAGSGTTLAVAQGHGHDTIGIDLDARNAVLAEQRVGGLFFEVDPE